MIHTCPHGCEQNIGISESRHDPAEHLDLLPHLRNRGYNAESVHAVAVHGVPLSELMRVLTGVEWQPIPPPSTNSGAVG